MRTVQASADYCDEHLDVLTKVASQIGISRNCCVDQKLPSLPSP